MADRQEKLPATGKAVTTGAEPTVVLGDAGSGPVHRVAGRVAYRDLSPAAGTPIEAVHKGLRSDVPLGSALTGNDGTYDIVYPGSRVPGGRAPDLVVRATGGGSILAQSPVLFGAGPDERVDLRIDAAPQQPEFQRLLDAVTPLLDGTILTDLDEQAGRPDISLLAGKTGQPVDRIAALVVAYKLAARTRIAPEILYALARDNVSDLDTLAATGLTALRAKIGSAADRGIISPSYATRLDQVQAELRALAVRHAVAPDTAGPGPATGAAPGPAAGAEGLGTLLAGVLSAPADRDAFVDRYVGHDGPIDAFWDGLRTDPRFGSKVADLQFTLQVAALTGAHAPLVSQLLARRASGEIGSFRDLARWDRAGWEQQIRALSGPDDRLVPPDIPGTSATERIRRYAQTLADIVADAVPTAVLAHRTVADQTQPGQLRAFWQRVIDTGTDVDLGAVSVADLLRAHPQLVAEGSDTTALVMALKAQQRLSNLGRYEEIRPLQTAGISSATDIVRYDQDTFLQRHGSLFADLLRARSVYAKAVVVAASAATFTATYHPAFDSGPWVTGDRSPKRIPNLTTLFGSMDQCACSDCRSLTSPAAYLVDVLEFLNERTHQRVNRLTRQTETVRALQTLTTRRPDLIRIELTCENTDTLVPQIDLVTEILEDAVAPFTTVAVAGVAVTDLDNRRVTDALRAGFATAGLPLGADPVLVVARPGQSWLLTDHCVCYELAPGGGTGGIVVRSRAYQSGAPAEQLAVQPEHVTAAAYDHLAGSGYPWSLPYDRWREETVTYLAHLGARRHEMMVEFGTDAPDEAWDTPAVVAEHLGMTASEAAIIAGTDPARATPWLSYGLPAGTAWFTAVARVPELLTRSGLTYDQLLDVLRTDYVNPGRATLIVGDSGDPDTCELDRLVLQPAGADLFDRLHRFVRLSRRTGWTMRELDQVVKKLGGGTLSSELLRTVSHLKRIRARLDLAVEDLVVFWSELPTDGDYPLYTRLFADPSVLNPDDATAFQTPQGTGYHISLDLHRDALLAAFGVTDIELDGLLGAVLGADPGADPVPVPPEAVLSLANLSAIYRRARLARALDLPIADLLTLVRASGANPFAPLDPVPTKATLWFLRIVDLVQAGGLSVAELDYLINHRGGDQVAWAPDDGTIADTLAAVRTGLAKIRTDTQPQPDPTGEFTREAMASLRWPASWINDAIGALAGTTWFRAPLAALPAGIAVPAGFGDRVVYDATAATGPALTVAGALTSADRDALRAVSADPAYLVAVDTLYAAPRTVATTRMAAFDVPALYRSDPLNLPTDLAFPDPLRRQVFYDLPTRQLCFAGVMADDQKAALLALRPGDVAYARAIEQLFAAPAQPPAPDNAFLTPALADQIFELPAAPDRFGLVLAALLDHVRASARTGFVVTFLAQTFGLPEQTMRVLLGHLGGMAATSADAVTDVLDSAFADSSPSQPVTRAAFPAQFTTFIRVAKVVRLVAALRLAPTDLDWLTDVTARVPPRPVAWLADTTGQTGWLRLDDLPTDAMAPRSTVRLAGWLRLVELSRVRDGMPGGSATLRPVLQAGTGTVGGVLDALAAATGWNRGDLGFLAGSAALGLATGESDPVSIGPLVDETGLARLLAAARRVRQLGAPAARCRAFAEPVADRGAAYAARQLAKAKYDRSEWADVAAPLRDTLRVRQRDVLVDYLVGIGYGGAGSARDLYDYFLIDVEMAPCAMTSRIKQAISSVQQFVQRVLLNLERDITADETVDAGWRRWEWMRNYRIWQANREIFCFPENWLEPELRADKSPFFQAAEAALSASELTPELAGDVFRGYLDNLHAVAHLETVGMWLDPPLATGTGAGGEVLHVFGRSVGESATVHYYRQRTDGRWTAWERIDLDIADKQLIPVMWRGHLYLFWPIFAEVSFPVPPRPPRTTPPERDSAGTAAPPVDKDLTVTVTPPGAHPAAGPSSGDPSLDALQKQLTSLNDGVAGLNTTVSDLGDPPKPIKAFSVQLAWSVRKDGVWQPRKMSSATIMTRNPPDDREPDLGKSRYAFRTLQDADGGLLVWFQYEPDREVVGLPLDQDSAAIYFTASGRTYEPDPAWQAFANRVDPPAHTHVEGMLFLEDRDNPETALYLPAQDRDAEVKALGRTPAGTFELAYPHFDGTVYGRHPFFFADNERTYFVEPVELTVKPIGLALDPRSVGTATVGSVRRKYYGAWSLAGDRRAIAGPAVTMATTLPAVDRKVIRGGLTLAQYVSDTRLAGGAPMVVSGPLPPTLRVYRFWTGFHPYTADFLTTLNRDGLDVLLRRETQAVQRDTFDRYEPQPFVVDVARTPAEDVDFAYQGVYSLYNWELFFHLPLLIACRLMQNQRFEDARRWFHMIFNPTDASTPDAPSRFWQTKPLHAESQAQILSQRIGDLIDELARGTADETLARQMRLWVANPGQPHVLAELRPVAYMRNVVMKYLDNLIAWGDQLFARDTLESINEATELYVLAANLLGPRPSIIAPRGQPQVHTFDSLHTSLDEFSDPVVEVEYLFGSARPDSLVLAKPGQPSVDVPTIKYFCVPTNDTLLAYWDAVAGRLFKIRNCQNIEGVERQLPLFEPPIDPALLVRAVAAGLDIGAVLNGASAPAPSYRFTTMLAKAGELCNEVKAMGAALLSALEKRDAEHLGLLRSEHEVSLLAAVERIRVDAQDEARRQHEQVLPRAREATIERWRHYQRMLGKTTLPVLEVGKPVPMDQPPALATPVSGAGMKLTRNERAEFGLAATAFAKQQAAAELNHTASILGIFGDIKLATEPMGVGISYQNGSSFIARAMQAAGEEHSIRAASLNHRAAVSAKASQIILRENDWVLQSNLAARDIMHLDQQILAAAVRQEIAGYELENHRAQMVNAATVRDFLQSKFTGEQLYSWTIARIAQVYFAAYQLAYDLARRAERAYRHELGLDDSTFIAFGYWDSLRKGLLAGETLHHDLRRMEADFLTRNRREYELTKRVSLATLDPDALLWLRRRGSCEIHLPEALFDLDCPGHYLRRLKSVSLTMPCVAGPYTGVNATVTLLRSQIRTKPDLLGTDQTYARAAGSDPRFRDIVGIGESMVTSGAHDDSGLFETNLRDERYLPFEGAGAISDWRLTLPGGYRQFDYDTIADVVLTLRYTAREGGGALREGALAQLPKRLADLPISDGRTGLYRMFSARHDFPDAWRALLADTGDAPALTLAVGVDRMPYVFRDHRPTVDAVAVIVHLADDRTPDGRTLAETYRQGNPLTVTLNAAPGQRPQLRGDSGFLAGDPHAEFTVSVPLGSVPAPFTVGLAKPDVATLDPALRTADGRLDPRTVSDIMVIMHYRTV